MYFTLNERWLIHVLRMGEERIPKSILYSKLVVGNCNRGRPALRFKDVCKHDIKNLSVINDDWEAHANDRDKW